MVGLTILSMFRSECSHISSFRFFDTDKYCSSHMRRHLYWIESNVGNGETKATEKKQNWYNQGVCFTLNILSAEFSLVCLACQWMRSLEWLEVGLGPWFPLASHCTCRIQYRCTAPWLFYAAHMPSHRRHQLCSHDQKSTRNRNREKKENETKWNGEIRWW